MFHRDIPFETPADDIKYVGGGIEKIMEMQCIERNIPGTP